MSTSLFIGIGGAGMRGLAYLLRERGEIVIGFDNNSAVSEVSLLDARTALKTVDRVVYSDAVVAEHELRVDASKQGIIQLPYQKALGEFSRQYTTLAVTGTHGKSSTTAFLAHICITAGLDPTVLVGAGMDTLRGKHAQLGKGAYFIVEADEYRKHFLELTPAHSIITTIDFDHPDAFSSLRDVEKVYEEFLALQDSDGMLIIPEKEKNAHPDIAYPANTITVSENDISDIHVPLPGTHMRMNAALAITLAESIGVPRQSAIDSLATFPGLSRRFELLGTVNGCDIRSDYGHHPAEIVATITGAREVYPHASITAVFEAHMPLRLRTFFSAFADALSFAEEVVIVQPFAPAGRDESATEDIFKLRDELMRRGIKATISQEYTDFMHTLKTGSVALLFSAGSLDAEVRKTVNKG